ncbi:hypothetical protein PAEPH01_2966 [Pancytospora epiphaga]|nr:hypothetical protein PAEPH01_2966 [Pancytospora epiphaga]
MLKTEGAYAHYASRYCEDLVPFHLSADINAQGKQVVNEFRQLQHIIKFIDWFRLYIKNLSILIAPITEKLKTKKKPVQWTETDQRRLNTIVKHIEDRTVLNYPDVTQLFTLETNASGLGVGAVLTRRDKLIGLYSCKSLPAGTQYTTME